MKKKKKLILIGITLFMIFSLSKKVLAEVRGKLVMKYQYDVYYKLVGEKLFMSYPFPLYSIDGQVVYCIEPGVNINTYNYIGEDGFINSPYSEEVNKLLELIGYYGYGYFGHDTLKYRLATQELIWELVKDCEVTFSNVAVEPREEIDVSFEKEEIMRLVNNHLTKPSFDEKQIILEYGNTITITDSNNVLSGYEIYQDDGYECHIEGNNLTIKINKLGDGKIKLRRKAYDSEHTVLFVGEDGISQKVGKFRASLPVESIIYIKALGAKLKIIKVDKESREAIPISHIKFKIKNITTDKYICENDECLFETNDKGVIQTNTVLYGKYKIEEVENQDLSGYLWNNIGKELEINENTLTKDNIYEVEFENTPVKGSIKINKKGESLVYQNDTYYYEEIFLKDVKFGIYADEDIYYLGKIIYHKDELINTITTNNLGQAMLDNLYLGKYYIKEISSNLGNLVDNTKYKFEIKYKDKYTPNINLEFNLKNYLPKGKLKFIKLDSNNKSVIKDTLMEIYTIDNTLIYSGKTDEFGLIEIDDLPLGKYYIKEKESAMGYENKFETIYFEIKEDSEVIKLSLTNDYIFEVPNTKLNEINIIFICGTILILLGGIIYVKKK